MFSVDGRQSGCTGMAKLMHTSRPASELHLLLRWPRPSVWWSVVNSTGPWGTLCRNQSKARRLVLGAEGWWWCCQSMVVWHSLGQAKRLAPRGASQK